MHIIHTQLELDKFLVEYSYTSPISQNILGVDYSLSIELLSVIQRQPFRPRAAEGC